MSIYKWLDILSNLKVSSIQDNLPFGAFSKNIELGSELKMEYLLFKSYRMDRFTIRKLCLYVNC